MKNILIIISVFITIISFNACGGGGGDSSAPVSSAQTIINIDVICAGDTPDKIATYIELLSGDTIIKDVVNTTIKTYNEANSTSRVCLVNGTAHILRP